MSAKFTTKNLRNKVGIVGVRKRVPGCKQYRKNPLTGVLEAIVNRQSHSKVDYKFIPEHKGQTLADYMKSPTFKPPLLPHEVVEVDEDPQDLDLQNLSLI